jgi:hypothetical protein
MRRTDTGSTPFRSRSSGASTRKAATIRAASRAGPASSAIAPASSNDRGPHIPPSLIGNGSCTGRAAVKRPVYVVLGEHGEVPGREDELRPPPGELVQRGGLLGDARRVLEDHPADLRAHRQRARAARGGRDERPHVLVVDLVGAVAGPEAEPIHELDRVEQLAQRLFWKKLVAEAHGAIPLTLMQAVRHVADIAADYTAPR